ncbi:MAG: hypothetical protein V7746_01015 [Halioglobus sp.]
MKRTEYRGLEPSRRFAGKGVRLVAQDRSYYRHFARMIKAAEPYFGRFLTSRGKCVVNSNVHPPDSWLSAISLL